MECSHLRWHLPHRPCREPSVWQGREPQVACHQAHTGFGASGVAICVRWKCVGCSGRILCRAGEGFGPGAGMCRLSVSEVGGMPRAPSHRVADAEGASGTGAVQSGRTASASSVEHPPTVAPLAPSAERPFWSVMIPIYNCREDYLRETLGSVIRQDPGVEHMQIEVLDNCSTIGDPPPKPSSARSAVGASPSIASRIISGSRGTSTPASRGRAVTGSTSCTATIR